MEGFSTLEQIAHKWGISVRRARILCAEGRIHGAFKEKNTWFIPVDANKPDDQRVTSGKYIKTERTLKRGKRTVLVADDSKFNRQILRETLESTFDIIEACDGEEAIDRILENKDRLSMIYLDLVMPKYNGIDVLKVMQKNGLKNRIPVIMITGEATEESDICAHENGVTDIIYKPFSSRVILQRSLNIIELFEHRFFLEKELENRTQDLINKIEEQEKIIVNLKQEIDCLKQ